MLREDVLIVDLYSLLPAFTLAGLLAILLWPEDIAYKDRLRLSMVILFIWVGVSFLGMAGFGTTEKPLVCLINAVVGILGLIALFATYRTKPVRRSAQNPPPQDR